MWKVSENESIMILKRVENIVAKGEIAHDEQFLLLSQCFQNSFAAEASWRVYMWERVKQNSQEIVKGVYPNKS